MAKAADRTERSLKQAIRIAKRRNQRKKKTDTETPGAGMLRRAKALPKKIRNHLEFRIRLFHNRPLPFMLVDKEGKKVGRPFQVPHLSLFDMAEHAACWQLTHEVLLNGLEANAFQFIGFNQLNENCGITTVQPRFLSDEEIKRLIA